MIPPPAAAAAAVAACMDYTQWLAFCENLVTEQLLASSKVQNSIIYDYNLYTTTYGMTIMYEQYDKMIR